MKFFLKKFFLFNKAIFINTKKRFKINLFLSSNLKKYFNNTICFLNKALKHCFFLSNVGGSPTADHHYAYITPEEGVIIGTTIVVISVFTLMASCNLKKKTVTEYTLEEYLSLKRVFQDKNREVDFLENQYETENFLKGINKDFLNYGKTNLSDVEHS